VKFSKNLQEIFFRGLRCLRGQGRVCFRSGSIGGQFYPYPGGVGGSARGWSGRRAKMRAAGGGAGRIGGPRLPDADNGALASMETAAAEAWAGY
jgi:hypothetical protein